MIGSEPVLSVSDFVAIFNQSLDVMYPSVVIVGELANFRVSKGAWVYCDLKDEFSSVKFFGSVRILPGPLEDGMMLEVVGRPYLHPKFGFSIQISAIKPVGEGSIKKAQNLLAQKLEKEGLFDPARKRVLPFPPERIGLITSAESAAYSDFAKIISQRWPALEVELFDVQVQGGDAPAQIFAAFEAANQKNHLDALVLIRGGGSKDDMHAFDHELVIRAVAASRVPTLVAIGHERDVALAELAADVRASTPSNAAELLVPDVTAEQKSLLLFEQTYRDVLKAKYNELRQEMRHVQQQIGHTLELRAQDARSRLDLQKQLANVLDPKRPLSRGFVLVRNSHGKMVRTKDQAQNEYSLLLEFGDGDLRVQTDKVQ